MQTLLKEGYRLWARDKKSACVYPHTASTQAPTDSIVLTWTTISSCVSSFIDHYR